jgi:hypothetical protein
MGFTLLRTFMGFPRFIEQLLNIGRQLQWIKPPA